MTTFQIQNNDGTFNITTHDKFFDSLNSGQGYLYYNSGGTHLALLPTPDNAATLRVCRQADKAEQRINAAYGRCLDLGGRLCRYQHDENGNFIRNESGKLAGAKCSDCPRNGWMTGRKENCCIRLHCTTPDCSRCTNLRKYRTPLSLERFNDESFEHGTLKCDSPIATDDIARLLANMEEDELNAALHSAIEQLPSPEREVVIAISLKGLTYRAFEEESGIDKSKIHRIYKRAVALLKNILKEFC